MLGKIALVTVYGCAIPALVALHLFVSTLRRAPLSPLVFLERVYDGVVGDKPDFLDFLFCMFFAVVDVLLLAVIGLAVAYFTKGS